MGTEPLPETPTRGAQIACAAWLAGCVQFGWDKSQLDFLEGLWWKYHDTRGNLMPPGTARRGPVCSSCRAPMAMEGPKRWSCQDVECARHGYVMHDVTPETNPLRLLAADIRAACPFDGGTFRCQIAKLKRWATRLDALAEQAGGWYRAKDVDDLVAPAAPRAVPQTRVEMLRWHLAEVQRLGGSPRALAAIGDAIAEELLAPRAEKET